MTFELGTDGPTVIVVGVDGSPTSLHAGAYAAGLCRRQGAKLVVVHVIGNAALTAPGSQGMVREAQDEIEQDLRAQVEEQAEHLGVHATFVSRRGDPFTELTAVCDEVRAEAVVVGASASPGHKLVGSLAVRLVKAGKWPVTVVP